MKQKGEGFMELYGMQVNHLENPLGFRMKRTVFSWKVRGAAGTCQKAARIRVATDDKMEQIVADTGFAENADSRGFGVELKMKSCTRYYWKVTVQSDAGEEAESPVQWFETAKREDPWVGKWITCNNEEKRHPRFEKKIQPSKEVKTARLYISGLGLYEAFVDGVRIGEEYLTPYSNDYNAWVQYQTYDVTEAFRQGGTLSVLLGNGWYKARFGFRAKKDVGFYGNEWKLIAEVRFVYSDGTSEIIGTDDTWKVKRSKLTFSNLYDGEHR